MNKVDLYYATDPLCSFCWAFEPTLRKFRYQYAHYFKDEITVMGGMIENWETFGGDAQNGIQSAVDVAQHWREIGDYTRMVIDGRIWLDEPIHSSYPSSQAYEIVRRDYPERAQEFLRKLRENVMVWNQDIAKQEVLAAILDEMGLNSERILSDAASYEGRTLLNSDLSLARALTATGFPTVVLVNEDNRGVKIVGAQPIEALEDALKQILEVDELLPIPVPSLDIVMQTTPFLLNKEIEVLYSLEEFEVPAFVDLITGSENVQKGSILGQNYYRRLTKE